MESFGFINFYEPVDFKRESHKRHFVECVWCRCLMVLPHTMKA
ncbi:hypothetical protein KP509_20G085700 [Ceratopteris richardii]|uniref:Uncharacterized protein n=1 Tax=Ceratopteris richardii TaxID=49495 RepID=A0A8T2SHR9_CERRI|nr:hypothetical protein KP509_20G085700 [Ceratopteris richardii]